MSLNVDQITKPLRVKSKIQETSDTVSLAFEIPPELRADFSYKAGQFVNVFLDVGGEKINRSYSLCTSPLADAEFKITIKKVPGGKASTFLVDQVQQGDVLKITRPAGNFFKPSLDSTHYYLFGAGSGITPLMSILKTVLHSSPFNEVTLCYCNRNENSIIFKNELEALTKEFGNRLNIHHLLSQPSESWKGARGRCTPDWLKQNLDKSQQSKLDMEFYLCGPDGFMETVRMTLRDLGFADKRIHSESFAVGLHAKPQASVLRDDWTYIGDKAQAQDAKLSGKLIAQIQGENVECELKPDQTLLEALLEAGANPPYSCMDGSCMACLAKVKEGLVYQMDPGILSEDNIENGETLTCQARVLSRTVKVSYDEI